MLKIGEKIMLTLWIGSLWSIGFIVIPTLFGTLDDRQLAGMLAGKLLTLVSYIGIFCALMLIISEFMRSQLIKENKRVWLLALMTLIILIGEFLIQPQMAELKQLGLIEGSQTAQKFAQLHGVSSVLYVFNAFLGLILISFKFKNSG